MILLQSLGCFNNNLVEVITTIVIKQSSRCLNKLVINKKIHKISSTVCERDGRNETLVFDDVAELQKSLDHSSHKIIERTAWISNLAVCSWERPDCNGDVIYSKTL